MPNLTLLITLSLCLLFPTQASQAYGSGGGGSCACDSPSFYDESPQRNSVVGSLGEFSVTASDNTELSSLHLEVNGQSTPPTITALRSGESRLHVGFPAPLTHAGKVQITLAAKSKDGCAAFQAFYLEIKP